MFLEHYWLTFWIFGFAILITVLVSVLLVVFAYIHLRLQEITEFQEFREILKKARAQKKEPKQS